MRPFPGLHANRLERRAAIVIERRADHASMQRGTHHFDAITQAIEGRRCVQANAG